MVHGRLPGDQVRISNGGKHVEIGIGGVQENSDLKFSKINHN